MEHDIKAAVDALGQGVDAFRSEYEQKLAQVDKRFDRLSAALGRSSLRGPGDCLSGEQIAHKEAFAHFMRKGTQEGLAEIEAKALSTGVTTDGGFAVPTEIDGQIESLLIETSPIRQVARVVEIGSSDWKTLVSVSGAAPVGWVGETAPRTETDTPTFQEVVPPLGEIYANPAATQAMLDDAFFNVEEFLAENIAEEFASAEGAAFVAGDGINKPKGFLQAPTATAGDATRAFGTLQYVPTGVAGGFPATNPADILFDVIDALRPGYRQGAVWVMNSATANRVRKFKDSSGQYLWLQGLVADTPDRLLGYPVVISEDMPVIATDGLSIAFGNFRRGYVITDRRGVRVLRDPFSNKPFVHFYTTKRVGGGVVNSQAIKLLKFGLT